MASPEIEMLTQALSRLPGLGPRSARRAVLHLLKRREGAMEPLLRALIDDRAGIESLSIERPGLHDAFVAIAGAAAARQMQDGADEEAQP